jgi:homogentisate 1,2-dioxygenase
MIFIHKGREITHHDGNILLNMEITLIIPRGIIYQIDFETAVNRLLYVESRLFIRQNDTKNNQANT